MQSLELLEVLNVNLAGLHLGFFRGFNEAQEDLPSLEPQVPVVSFEHLDLVDQVLDVVILGPEVNFPLQSFIDLKHLIELGLSSHKFRSELSQLLTCIHFLHVQAARHSLIKAFLHPEQGGLQPFDLHKLRLQVLFKPGQTSVLALTGLLQQGHRLLVLFQLH